MPVLQHGQASAGTIERKRNCGETSAVINDHALTILIESRPFMKFCISGCKSRDICFCLWYKRVVNFLFFCHDVWFLMKHHATEKQVNIGRPGYRRLGSTATKRHFCVLTLKCLTWTSKKLQVAAKRYKQCAPRWQNFHFLQGRFSADRPSITHDFRQ